jgi:hypothetical protein
VYVLGGYNTFGVGARIDNTLALPPHYKIKIKFNFWKIDSWDAETA